MVYDVDERDREFRLWIFSREEYFSTVDAHDEDNNLTMQDHDSHRQDHVTWYRFHFKTRHFWSSTWEWTRRAQQGTRRDTWRRR